MQATLAADQKESKPVLALVTKNEQGPHGCLETRRVLCHARSKVLLQKNLRCYDVGNLLPRLEPP